MITLTNDQKNLEHILGTSQEHRAWHSSFDNSGAKCPFCEALEDLELYIQARSLRSGVYEH